MIGGGQQEQNKISVGGSNLLTAPNPGDTASESDIRSRLIRVVNYGHPALRKKADEVLIINPFDRILIEDMMDVVASFPALGLAAPQLGHNKRIIVVNTITKVIPIINPVLAEISTEESSMTEGCMSILGATEDILRPSAVRVVGLDSDFREVSYEWEGMLAHVVQHEIDHLNGIMMVDHLKEYKRNKMLKTHRKFIRDHHMPVHSYKVITKTTA